MERKVRGIKERYETGICGDSCADPKTAELVRQKASYEECRDCRATSFERVDKLLDSLINKEIYGTRG